MHVETAGARECLAELRGDAAAWPPAQQDQVHGNDQGILPDVFTYNAAISAGGKGCITERALQVLIGCSKMDASPM